MSRSLPLRRLPSRFLRALARAGLESFFQESAFVHRAGYASWIAEAKRAATREERIRLAVARLREEHDKLAASKAGGSECGRRDS